MTLLRKLHQNYLKSKDSKNGSKDDKDNKDSADNNDFKKDRKPNFFERKRFLNYEKNEDSDDD